MGANNQPKTQQERELFFREYHCTLLTKEYKNNTTRLEYVCDEHPNVIQTTTWKVFSRGNGCHLCNIEKRAQKQRCSFDDVKKAYEALGYILLDTEYKNSHTPMRFICPKHRDKGIQQVTYSHLKEGHGCKYCGYEHDGDAKRTDISIIRQEFANRGYELLTQEYKNMQQKLPYRCLKHPESIQYITYDKFHYRGQGCRKCAVEQGSKGEQTIQDILTKYNIQYNTQQTFETCKDICCLRFDFYLPNCNTAIEYDGEQHYFAVNFGGVSDSIATSNLQTTQYHDQIKTQYCQDNGIKLIRIPYWEKDNIEPILKKELNICKI